MQLVKTLWSLWNWCFLWLVAPVHVFWLVPLGRQSKQSLADEGNAVKVVKQRFLQRSTRNGVHREGSNVYGCYGWLDGLLFYHEKSQYRQYHLGNNVGSEVSVITEFGVIPGLGINVLPVTFGTVLLTNILISKQRFHSPVSVKMSLLECS